MAITVELPLNNWIQGKSQPKTMVFTMKYGGLPIKTGPKESQVPGVTGFAKKAPRAPVVAPEAILVSRPSLP